MGVREQSRIMSERPRRSPKRLDAWYSRAPGRWRWTCSALVGCQSRNDSGGANVIGVFSQLEHSLDV